MKPTLWDAGPGALPRRKIAVPCQGAQKVVPISDIVYLEVIRHQVILHLANKTTVEFRGSLKGVVEQIGSPWFVQCHKSFCVNLSYIDSTTAQTITTTNQDTIPIGRNKKEAFEKSLREFLRGSMTCI